MTTSSTYTRPSRSGCILIRKLYFRSHAMSSVLRNFRIMGRIVCDMSPEPRDCRVRYPIAEFSFLLLTPRVLPVESRQFSICGCRTFTACVVWQLLFPNSRIIAARHSVGNCVSIFVALSAPCSGGFRGFFAALFAANLLPCTRQFGRELPVHQTAVFLHACCISNCRVLYQHSCWFKSFRYIVPAVPVLVGCFGDSSRTVVTLFSQVTSVSPAVGSFFFIGVPVRPIAG